MQIRKYVMQHNVPQMPKSTQDIIRTQQEQANNYETSVKDALRKAIENAQFTLMVNILHLKVVISSRKSSSHLNTLLPMFTANSTLLLKMQKLMMT